MNYKDYISMLMIVYKTREEYLCAGVGQREGYH